MELKKTLASLALIFAFNTSAPILPMVATASVATIIMADQAKAECNPEQAQCVTYRCPNGITLRGVGAMTQSAVNNACNRELGGKGATKVADGCIKMEVGRVPKGTRSLIIAVHNPATFRQDCGVQFCQDCAPDHSEWGKPDLIAELPIVDGFVQVPASWFQGKLARAWLCIRGTHLSVALHKQHLNYLLANRRTPYGDPLAWAKSRFMVNG